MVLVQRRADLVGGQQQHQRPTQQPESPRSHAASWRRRWVLILDGGHIDLCRASEIFRDVLELVHGRTGCLRLALQRVSQAMIQMIVDQGLLGRANGSLYGVQLLRHVQTGLSCINHCDDILQMPGSAFEAIGDLGMAFVNMI